MTSAAFETLSILIEEKVVDAARETGDYFMAALGRLKESHGCIQQLRGKGLLLGIQLDGPADGYVTRLMERGYLVNCVQGDTLRFVPPLIVTREEIDALIDALDGVLP